MRRPLQADADDATSRSDLELESPDTHSRHDGQCHGHSHRYEEHFRARGQRNLPGGLFGPVSLNFAPGRAVTAALPSETGCRTTWPSCRCANDAEGRACYRRKLGAGKASMEAVRCLKGRLPDQTYLPGRWSTMRGHQ